MTARKAAPAAKKARASKPKRETTHKHPDPHATINGLPARAMKTIRRGEQTVKRLSKMGLIYWYGGGRVGGHVIEPTPDEKWTDCSGCGCYVLTKMGIKLKNPAGSTWSLVEEGEQGESDYLTLYVKNDHGDEHVIIRGRKRPKPWHFGRPRFRWWECGGSDNPTPNGGPSFFIPGLKMGLGWKQRVAEFYDHRNFDKELGIR